MICFAFMRLIFTWGKFRLWSLSFTLYENEFAPLRLFDSEYKKLRKVKKRKESLELSPRSVKMTKIVIVGYVEETLLTL